MSSADVSAVTRDVLCVSHDVIDDASLTHKIIKMAEKISKIICLSMLFLKTLLAKNKTLFPNITTIEELIKVIKPVFHSNPRPRFRGSNDQVRDVTLAVEPTLRKKIGDHLLIDCESCRVRSADLVRQCFRCFRFGHIATSCPDVFDTKTGTRKAPEDIPAEHCSHCAERHSVTDCPDREDATTTRCHVCISAARVTGVRRNENRFKHSPLSRICPQVKKYIETMRLRTDNA